MASYPTRAFAPFVQVPKWILTLGPFHIAVYAALSAFDGERGCFPSVASLAVRAGVSERKAREALRDLEAEEAICVTRRARDDNGASTSLYDLRPAWSASHARSRDPLGTSCPPGAARPAPEQEQGLERHPVLAANAASGGVEDQEHDQDQDQDLPLDANGNGSPRAQAREDVAELCDLLASHVERIQNRRPTVGANWHRDMRLLRDADERSVMEVRSMILWLGGPGGARFWDVNILSPRKLRAHWPKLIAEMRRDRPDAMAAAISQADRLAALGQ